jgi:catechol-2,3-dioxygenase
MKIELHHINLSTDKVDEMNEFYLKVMNLKTETEGLPILERGRVIQVMLLLFQMVKSKLTWQKKT